MPPSPTGTLATAAWDAARFLLGDRPGVSLIGPSAQTGRTIRLIVERLSDRNFVPVDLVASDTTPDALRRKVGKAHGDRPTPDTGLLLVVSRVERLSQELLDELEVAAAAAAEHGGLKLLMATMDDPEPTIRPAKRPHLAACARTRLHILAAAPQPYRDLPMVPDTFARLPNEAALAHAARPAPRIMLAMTVLAILALILAGGIIGRMPSRPAARMASVTHPSPVIMPAPIPLLPTPAPAPVSKPQLAVQPFALHGSDPLPVQVAAPPMEEPAEPPQEASLLLMAGPGDTLSSLFAQVYRGTTPPSYEMVAALNPTVHVGTRLVFPAPPDGWPSAKTGQAP